MLLISLHLVFFSSWPCAPLSPPSVLCYLLQHVLLLCHITKRLLSRRPVSLQRLFRVFFSLFGALHLAEYRLIIITFRRKAPGSITISLKYVGGADKSGQQVLVRFSFISELLCLSFPSLCTPSVIRKEPRSRLTRHTHIRTHQITQYDWFQAVLGVCCLCFQL